MENNDEIIIHIDSDIQKLIPKFLKNRHQDVVNILEALKQQDVETVFTLGHNMKGMGTAYGFDTISDIGANIEKAAMEKDSEGMRKLAGELLDYLQRVKIIYG